MDRADAAARLRPYLLPGERILWTGRPVQGPILVGADAFLIPFSLLWGGFVIFWNVMVWTFPGSGPDMFRLFGLPFLAIAIYFLVGRFVHDAAVRKKLVYAVTDRRALILRASRSPKLHSKELRALPALELEERAGGTGTISFNATAPFFGSMRYGGFDWWFPSLRAGSEFYRIERVRDVYLLIRDHAFADRPAS